MTEVAPAAGASASSSVHEPGVQPDKTTANEGEVDVGAVSEDLSCRTPPTRSSGPSSQPNLTPEQRARIEQNRLLAMRKRQQLQDQQDQPKQVPDMRGQENMPPQQQQQQQQQQMPGGKEGITTCKEEDKLTAEQLDRIHQHRLLALKRRLDNSTGLTDEQRAKIQRNYTSALERQHRGPSGVDTNDQGQTGRAPPSPASSAPSTPDLPPLPCWSPSGFSAVSSSPPGSPRSPDSTSSSSSSSSSASSSRCSSAKYEDPDAGISAEKSESDDDSSATNDEQPYQTPNCEEVIIMRKDLGAPRTNEASGQVVPPSKPPKERSPKQDLVAKILCRWWYVFPPWPPEDFDYEAALHDRGFRLVDVAAFHLEPERDVHGREKVFALKDWLGLYRTGYGELVDVRPVEGRPSYDRLMLRSTPELHRLLITALSRQLVELRAQPIRCSDDEVLLQELGQELTKAKRKASFVLSLMPTGKGVTKKDS